MMANPMNTNSGESSKTTANNNESSSNGHVPVLESDPSSSTSTDNGLRQRGPPSTNSLSNGYTTAPTNPNANVNIPLPQPQPQPPHIPAPRNQNLSTSLIFIFLGLALAFGLGRILIQFQTEVNLDQLSRKPVSPFKSVSIPSPPPPSHQGEPPIPSSPPPKPKITKPLPGIYNDIFGPPNPQPPEVISVVKDNIELEPEYVEYAQQLKLVLGTLKKAIGRLAENSTEVAGLVKMKPNKEPKTRSGEVKLESDPSKILEDDDSDGLDLDVVEGKIKSPDPVAEESVETFDSESESFKIPIPAGSEPQSPETPDQLEKTLEFRQKSQEPATNPYDAIIDYRKKNAHREEELNDLVLNEEPENIPDSIYDEIEHRKQEKDKLMNELIHYFFQNYREGTDEELDLQDTFYKDVTESELESIRYRLHDTLFSEPRDLKKDMENNIIYDDLDDDGIETVFDEELGMQVKLDVKEELDSLEGEERKFVYDGLRRQFKIEEKMKEGMNKLVKKEKESELEVGDGNGNKEKSDS